MGKPPPLRWEGRAHSPALRASAKGRSKSGRLPAQRLRPLPGQLRAPANTAAPGTGVQPSPRRPAASAHQPHYRTPPTPSGPQSPLRPLGRQRAQGTPHPRACERPGQPPADRPTRPVALGDLPSARPARRLLLQQGGRGGLGRAPATLPGSPPPGHIGRLVRTGTRQRGLPDRRLAARANPASALRLEAASPDHAHFRHRRATPLS